MLFLHFSKTPQNVLGVPRVWVKTKYAILGIFKILAKNQHFYIK